MLSIIISSVILSQVAFAQPQPLQPQPLQGVLPMPNSEGPMKFTTFLDKCLHFRAGQVNLVPSPATIFSQVPPEWLQSSIPSVAAAAHRYQARFHMLSATEVQGFYNELCPTFPPFLLQDPDYILRMSMIRSTCNNVNTGALGQLPPPTAAAQSTSPFILNNNLTMPNVLFRQLRPVFFAVAQANNLDFNTEWQHRQHPTDRDAYLRQMWDLLRTTAWNDAQKTTFWRTFCWLIGGTSGGPPLTVAPNPLPLPTGVPGPGGINPIVPVPTINPVPIINPVPTINPVPIINPVPTIVNPIVPVPTISTTFGNPIVPPVPTLSQPNPAATIPPVPVVPSPIITNIVTMVTTTDAMGSTIITPTTIPTTYALTTDAMGSIVTVLPTFSPFPTGTDFINTMTMNGAVPSATFNPFIGNGTNTGIPSLSPPSLSSSASSSFLSIAALVPLFVVLLV